MDAPVPPDLQLFEKDIAHRTTGAAWSGAGGVTSQRHGPMRRSPFLHRHGRTPRPNSDFASNALAIVKTHRLPSHGI